MNDLEKLRFIQRVLEGTPPQSDKDDALKMVRELRALAIALAQLTLAQKIVIEMLREEPRRDLYEGGGQDAKGSGEYWVSYSAGVRHEPLAKGEIDKLLKLGLICEKWPGCYVLASG